MLYDFSLKVIRLLHERRALIVDSIVSGGFNSFENYKHACGKINGIDEAIKTVREALRKEGEEEE